MRPFLKLPIEKSSSLCIDWALSKSYIHCLCKTAPPPAPPAPPAPRTFIRATSQVLQLSCQRGNVLTTSEKLSITCSRVRDRVPHDSGRVQESRPVQNARGGFFIASKP